MRRFALLSLVGLGTAVLAGCPIYSDDDWGYDGWGGAGGNGLPPGGCDAPSDCGLNETCGADGECHPGDCTIWGCVTGFECDVDPDSLYASCVPLGSGGSGAGGSGAGGSGAGGAGAGGAGAGGAGGSGGSGGAPPIYCGNPDDCAPAQTCGPDGTCQAGDCSVTGCVFGFVCTDQGDCVHADPNACGSDVDCVDAGQGALCVSGVCTLPADQCADQTQCAGADQKCVDGKCIDGCADDDDCAPSFQCDVALGICTVPATPCVITNDCASPDLVCVDGACVPESNMGSCGPGEVWVENGCIPDQAASFICNVDGQQDVCASGSICLHHSCYISCAPPNQQACQGLAQFDVCKDVTTQSGTHAVCGSDENLGNDCDPTLGVGCPVGQICIDGYCK